MKYTFSLFAALLFSALAVANPDNIAINATAHSSNNLDNNFKASNVNDGLIMYSDKGEWACKGSVTSWGTLYLPWITLTWEETVNVDKVLLYDRVSLEEHTSGGTLFFSDGTEISVTAIPNDGSPKEIVFPSKNISWIKFEATDGMGINIGLSEIEVYASPKDYKDYVSWVNPQIETTRGRWFFCTPAARPFGMVGALAYTRNKNQGGGGYNYNSTEVRGFSQVNAWMLAGLNVLPFTGNVDVTKGEEEWKSPFKHESEIMQVGYHRLFLDKYKVWVESTSTERVSFYKFQFVEGGEGKVLLDVGSKLGSSSMNKARIDKIDDTRITGTLMATDRFWGGPDSVELFFAIDFDQTINKSEAWDSNEIVAAHSAAGDDVGLILSFDVEKQNTLHAKIAISYTSVNNAIDNLNGEIDHWDFAKVKNETKAIWNEYLGKIAVDGGSDAQKIKFYTDLWHVLLGRHKINDLNGEYPDYAYAKYDGKTTTAPMKIRQLPLDNTGAPKYNMYSFDALWLTQWNLNILWGLAWPEILDDFSACLLQYAKNGELLPRGACAGGYSFIMTGCPASNMLTSTYMKGLMTKSDPNEVFRYIKKNHLPGGMMSYESEDDLRFYIKNGWCPGNAGKTIEWAYQDWGLSQMAQKLGKKRDAAEFARRSHNWKTLYNEDQGLIFPKEANGEWKHLDPLDKSGWIEANAWQATWSLSHEIPSLIELMGGKDAFCDKLNYAFEKGQEKDFVYSYSTGYVSYANQPGCSNAHVFNHAGKPWLTQYWTRQVNAKAYGGITPDKGYGGHDEDQGQMGAVSALMSLGIMSLQGTQSITPSYDITSPIFDNITITLNPDYYTGKSFTIKTYGSSDDNFYIQNATLNGKDWQHYNFPHSTFEKGGVLEIWLGDTPNKDWGITPYEK